MKVIRYQKAGSPPQYGSLNDDGTACALAGSIESGFTPTAQTVSGFDLLPPAEPPAIYCIGANYRHHIEECGGMKVPERPLVFMKGINALQAHGKPIRIPRVCSATEVDYECELAVVIGKACKNATRASALDHVFGYTCANDVSARDWQLNLGGGQWCRGKGFDTFLPLGPVLVTADEIPDPNELRLGTILNGQTVQDWNTNDMVFDVAAIIEFLSQDTTLLPGTVIITGTPHGVGMARKPALWLKPGDTVEVEIEKIGRLTNPVQAAN
ncbi:MAG: 5-carboxymethyl-2-hydroxymuconate isomerase [Chthoniobacterales bacterium]|nr:5-carboxymethyl-2-hydroxymuconate isomerase [Chthoniobacterales bacterium]